MPNQPERPHADRGEPVQTLFDASAPRPDQAGRGGPLPEALRRYGERLAIPLRPDRPTVMINFVESLDGVVTIDPATGTGAEISGFHEPDRFVMGLLRSLADVIVVGAGTLRAAGSHTWTPRRVNAQFGDAYEAWRRDLGLAPQPTTLIVTGGGDVPVDHPALQSHEVPVIVVAPAPVADRLRMTLPQTVRVDGTSDERHVSAHSALAVAAATGARVVLSEGGPHLTGTFVAEGLVDELFLTLAPQLLGREPHGGGERYSFVEGATFEPENAPWSTLVSVHRSVDHLFLRYRFANGA
jgi:riboflavin biosynthesis pyrimidine reductase